MGRLQGCLLLLLTSCFAQASADARSISDADAHRQTDLNGGVFASGCTIVLDSQDQTLNLSALRQNVLAPAYPFSLRLVNCALTPGQNLASGIDSTLKVSFDRADDDSNNLFSLANEKNNGVDIKDSQLNSVYPRKDISVYYKKEQRKDALGGEAFVVDYTLELGASVAESKHENHHGSLRFNMIYD